MDATSHFICSVAVIVTVLTAFAEATVARSMKAIAVDNFRMVEILTLRAKRCDVPDLDARPAGNPAEGGRVEQSPTLDHLTAGFRER